MLYSTALPSKYDREFFGSGHKRNDANKECSSGDILYVRC